ncbi:MAG: hypothetical protein HZB59_02445 [Ignavibacteriales bacterium]|nr:hypothetical protein [Ignavibacteriales bacterium]
MWEIICAVVVFPINGVGFPSSRIQCAPPVRVNAEGIEVNIPITVHSPNGKSKWALAGCGYAKGKCNSPNGKCGPADPAG